MRKRCNRTPRPASKMLAPAQHTDLMVLPRMHLHLLLSGQADPQYMTSIVGVFNIAGSIGHLHQRNDIVNSMANAQLIMESLITDRRPPTDEEGKTITACFNIADRYIGVQQKHTLLKAAEYVDTMIATGKALTPCNPPRQKEDPA